MARAPRRGSGSVRIVKSGRYEVRATGPDGRRRDLGTFRTKKDTEQALAKRISERIDSGPPPLSRPTHLRGAGKIQGGRVNLSDAPSRGSGQSESRVAQGVGHGR